MTKEKPKLSTVQVGIMPITKEQYRLINMGKAIITPFQLFALINIFNKK